MLAVGRAEVRVVEKGRGEFCLRNEDGLGEGKRGMIT